MTIPKWPGSDATEWAGIGPIELDLRFHAELVERSDGVNPWEHTVTVAELDSILSSVLPKKG